MPLYSMVLSIPHCTIDAQADPDPVKKQLCQQQYYLIMVARDGRYLTRCCYNIGEMLTYLLLTRRQHCLFCRS